MKKFKILLISLWALVSITGFALPVYAQGTNEVCAGIGAIQPDGSCEDDNSVENVIRVAVSILSYIVGAVAIIMIILAGFKYTTSAGDSNNISAAKKMITYALVGIVVAVLAQVLVRFVITKATTPPPVPITCSNRPTEPCP